MRSRLITLLLLGFLFSLASAQTKTDSSRVFKTHSLQFKVYNFVSLSSFKGSMLSYKYHRSDKTAYRGGVGVRARRWDEEISRNEIYKDSTMVDEKRGIENVSIDFVVEYLRYFSIHNDVKIFAGCGPLASFDIYHTNNKDISGSGATYYFTYKNHSDRYDFGLSFSYGLEWFFRKNMSLHAEYGFDLTYFLDKNDQIEYTIFMDNSIRKVDKSETDYGIAIADRGALLGLSVYF
jgi:hypothetical protein